MNKQKYKVGDRVRIVEAYPDRHNGEIAEVVDPLYGVFSDLIRVKLWSGDFWNCVEVELIKVKHPVIVITSDGKTTTATMREGKKVLKTATATCSDKDTFSFDEGARVAFERLQGREPFPKKGPEFYNGKMVCIDNNNGTSSFTVGKVYAVKNGHFRFDNGFETSKEYKSIEEINGTFAAKFIPLVED